MTVIITITDKSSIFVANNFNFKMISKNDIMTDILIGAMLIFALLLAILVGIWHWLKGLFHKQEEEKDVAGFHGNSRESLWLITDHTFDLKTSWPLDFR